MRKATFEEWREYVEALNDDLPDPENLADVWENMPELSPPLIEGVLRQGHKLDDARREAAAWRRASIRNG